MKDLIVRLGLFNCIYTPLFCCCKDKKIPTVTGRDLCGFDNTLELAGNLG